MPYASRAPHTPHAIELVDDVVARQRRQLVVQHHRLHGEARQEDQQPVAPTPHARATPPQLQRVHEDDHLTLHNVQAQQRVQQQRLLLLLHLDVVLAQVCDSPPTPARTRVLLLEVDRHAVVQQLLLEERDVVVQRGRQDDVLTGGGDELHHLVHIAFVAVGKQLCISIRMGSDHIGLVDDEGVHRRENVVCVQLQMAQQKFGSGNDNISELVQAALLSVSPIAFYHLLLDVVVVKSDTVHLVTAKAGEALKAVVGLHAQLLRGHQHHRLHALRIRGKREDLLDRGNGVRHRLSGTGARLHQDILSG